MADKRELAALAIGAMQSAYAPYSGFHVGAALMTESGKVYTGCNIENASYGATVCAERVAIFKAVSEGERRIDMLAVAGGKDGNIDGGSPPCGICRQVMAEFMKQDAPVLVITSQTADYDEYTVGELLPAAFNGEKL